MEGAEPELSRKRHRSGKEEMVRTWVETSLVEWRGGNRSGGIQDSQVGDLIGEEGLPPAEDTETSVRSNIYGAGAETTLSGLYDASTEPVGSLYSAAGRDPVMEGAKPGPRHKRHSTGKNEMVRIWLETGCWGRDARSNQMWGPTGEGGLPPGEGEGWLEQSSQYEAGAVPALSGLYDAFTDPGLSLYGASTEPVGRASLVAPAVVGRGHEGVSGDGAGKEDSVEPGCEEEEEEVTGAAMLSVVTFADVPSSGHSTHEMEEEEEEGGAGAISVDSPSLDRSSDVIVVEVIVVDAGGIG